MLVLLVKTASRKVIDKCFVEKLFFSDKLLRLVQGSKCSSPKKTILQYHGHASADPYPRSDEQEDSEPG